MACTKHVTVTGSVQGVGFRYALARKARMSGITGWVRNSEDGTIEAVLQGCYGDVNDVLLWVSEGGPSCSDVDRIIEDRTFKCSDVFSDFVIRDSDG